MKQVSRKEANNERIQTPSSPHEEKCPDNLAPKKDIVADSSKSKNWFVKRYIRIERNYECVIGALEKRPRLDVE